MAATSVHEIDEERAGDVELVLDGNGRGKFVRSYRRTFRVACDSTHDGPVVARTAVISNTGIGLGSPYSCSLSELDLGVYVTAFRCQSEGSGDFKAWRVTIEYGQYDPDKIKENPLDESVKREWGFSQFERVVEKDTSGNAIVNSAGDPFDPPITADDTRHSLRITRNEATFDTMISETYKDCVNTDTFFGWDPGTVKVGSITASEQWSDYLQANYVVVQYEFQFNPDGWQKKPLDQGYRAKSGSTRKLIMVDGAPAQTPVPLDGSGAALSATGTPVFLTFNVYPTAAFSDFGFDS